MNKLLIFDRGYKEGEEGKQISFEICDNECEIEIASRDYGRWFLECSEYIYLNDDEMIRLRDFLNEALSKMEE